MYVFSMRRVQFLGASLSIVSLLSGCVDAAGPTSNSYPAAYRTAPQTAVQRAIGECVASVVAMGIIGAILGGSGDSRRNGAIAGAAVGAIACAVLLDVASRQDRARLAAAEQEALRANQARTTHFTTTSGKAATVRTRVAPAPLPKPAASTSTPTTKPKFTACRYSDQTVSVDGQSSSTPRQLWCRISTGDWQPMQG